MGLKKKGLEGGIKQRCRVGKNGYGVEKKTSRAGKNMCRVGKNDCRVGKETWGLKKTNLGLEKKIPETPLGECSTNWAEGWKNKIWKEVSKYEGGGKMWEEGSKKDRVEKKKVGGLKKSGSQQQTLLHEKAG